MKFVRSTRRPPRRGQATVEFAITSFVLTAMLAGFLGIIVMGLGSFQNNIAAESAGRLLDEHEDLLASVSTTSGKVYAKLKELDMYDEADLIISRDEWYDPAFREELPEINRALLGNYIFDPDLVPDGETELGAFRYRGAVVRNSDNDRLF